MCVCVCVFFFFFFFVFFFYVFFFFFFFFFFDFLNDIGQLAEEKISFEECFIFYFSSGGHLVHGNRTISAILVKKSTTRILKSF